MILGSKEVKELAYDLQRSENPTDILKAWHDFKGDFSQFTAIIALDEYRELSKTKVIVESFNGLRDCITFYLDTHNLYFLNEETLKTMFLNGKVDFGVDYSIMFDTNFASYIRKFVNNINLGDVGNDFYNLVDILIKKDFQYDYNIYLIENIKQVERPFTADCIISEEIIQTIVSFERFKSIDSDEYKSTGKVKYLISAEMAENEAKKTIEMYYRNPEMKPYIDDLINIQQIILLNLVGMFKVHFASKNGSKKKMNEYFRFLQESVGIYLEREAIIAYELFSKNEKLNIFNKINPSMKPETLYEKLDNIAWDFLIPRLMERSITIGGEGDYFLPLLLTFDKGLHNMLKLYPIKGVVFKNETLTSFPISSINTYEFYSEKGFDEINNWINTDPDTRKRIANHNRDNGYTIIEEQMELLKEIMFR